MSYRSYDEWNSEAKYCRETAQQTEPTVELPARLILEINQHLIGSYEGRIKTLEGSIVFLHKIADGIKTNPKPLDPRLKRQCVKQVQDKINELNQEIFIYMRKIKELSLENQKIERNEA